MHCQYNRAAPGVICVIGCGVVGSAHVRVLEAKGIQTRSVDPRVCPGSSVQDVRGAGIVFLCLPTLSDDEGVQDLDALSSVLSALEIVYFEGLVVIKSTVLPWNVRHLIREYNSLRIVVNPEFLTARNAEVELANASYFVVGADDHLDAHDLAQFYARYWPSASTIDGLTPEEAAAVKYLRNCSLAVQVALAAEISQAHAGIDWNVVARVAAQDRRVGTHLEQPGPDGKLGFGGACLVKDAKAMLLAVTRAGFEDGVLAGALRTNKKVRVEDAEA